MVCSTVIDDAVADDDVVHAKTLCGLVQVVACSLPIAHWPFSQQVPTSAHCDISKTPQAQTLHLVSIHPNTLVVP